MALVGAYSDRGRVKSVNQDACCFFEAETLAGRVIMAIVCDGVGGLSKGELASTTVIHRFSEWFVQRFPKFVEMNAQRDEMMTDLRNIWDTLLQVACEDIYAYGAKGEFTLGTTFTGMMVLKGRYLIGHVGDCRVYEVTGDGARQLTADQTLVAQQVAAGILTPEQAAHHPKRNVIMQSVGTQESVDPAFVTGEYNPRAAYVLCCDGFYNKLEPGDLQSAFAPDGIASRQTLQETCFNMVEAVMERGEKDNITALAFTDAVPDGAVGETPSAKPVAGASSPAGSAAAEDFDEEDSPTIVVEEDESPTMVVQGGDA